MLMVMLLILMSTGSSPIHVLQFAIVSSISLQVNPNIVLPDYLKHAKLWLLCRATGPSHCVIDVGVNVGVKVGIKVKPGHFFRF